MAGNLYDLISEKYDIALYIEEHGNEPSYQQKLKGLQGHYCAVRWVCADGSCFYRGLGFAFLESLLGKPQHLLRLVDVAEKGESVHDLLRTFNHREDSDSAVLYLRLVTSAFLRSRADFYQPFIEDAKCVDDFCAQNVEPMASVCDHIQITALTQALDIPLKLEYVDSKESVINEHIFPEGSSPCVYMLYKQNHYSLLYAQEEI